MLTPAEVVGLDGASTETVVLGRTVVVVVVTMDELVEVGWVVAIEVLVNVLAGEAAGLPLPHPARTTANATPQTRRPCVAGRVPIRGSGSAGRGR